MRALLIESACGCFQAAMNTPTDGASLRLLHGARRKHSWCKVFRREPRASQAAPVCCSVFATTAARELQLGLSPRLPDGLCRLAAADPDSAVRPAVAPVYHAATAAMPTSPPADGATSTVLRRRKSSPCLSFTDVPF